MSVIKVKDLDPSKIIFVEPKSSKYSKPPTQDIWFINYEIDGEKVQLKIQSPEIKYEAGGIPREGQYYPDVKSRTIFILPFCHDRRLHDDINYELIKQFYDKLVEIDDYCDTDTFRKQIFGDKKYNHYSCQRMVRIPEIDEENVKLDKYGNPYYRPHTVKIRLDLEKEEDPDNPKYIPKFSVFERVDNKRVQVELKTFEDVEKFIFWQCKCRFIISFSKLYAMKTKSGKDKKGYGITLKATSIEVQAPARSSKKISTNDAFIDSDDEDDVKSKVSITRNNNNNNNLDFADEDENNQDEINQNENNQDEESEIIHQVSIDNYDDEEEVIEEPKSKSKSKSKSKPKNV